MVSTNIVKKKINDIQYNLRRIRKFSSLPLDVFLNNDDAKDIVAHNLFILLQNVIDIGTHIIADNDLAEPTYLSDIPEILAKEKVISVELVKPLKAMVGLRNLIAHEYTDLNFAIIHRIIQNDLKDINRFLDDIIRFCKI